MPTKNFTNPVTKPASAARIACRSFSLKAFRLSAFFVCALLALPLSAQTTIIDSSTTIDQTRPTVTGNLVYSVNDGATLTFTSTRAAGAGAFFINGGGMVIGPSTPGGTGWTVFSHISGTQPATGSANVQGGAIQMQVSGTLDATNVTFDSNMASGNGAAIFVQNTTLLVTNGLFLNNVAFVSGGALQNATGNIAITSAAFIGNRAANAGGVINVAQAASVTTFTDATFQNNYAGNQGGVINGGASLSTTFNYTGVSGAKNFFITGNAAGGATISDMSTLSNAAPPFTPVAASGGFLSMGAGSVVFNVADGISLTIGDPNAASAAYDSIASTVATASLAKNGAGLMTLNADNSYYAGAFNVNGGKLLLGNSNATLGGSIVVNSGATFGGAGTVMSSGAVTSVASVTINSGATLQVGLDNAAAPQTLAINGLANFNSGATLSLGLFASNASDFLSMPSGTLNWAGTGTINLAAFATGTFTLAQWGAGNLADAGNLTVTLGGAPVGGRSSADLSIVSQQLILVTSLRNLSGTWAGPANGTWSSGGSGWDMSGEDTLFQNGDSISFVTGGSVAVAGSVVASEMDVSGANNLVFAGAGGITTDATSVQPGSTGLTDANGVLNKTGSGAVSFSNTGTNNFKGGVVIADGGVSFATPAQFVLAGASVAFVNTGTLTAQAGATGVLGGDIELTAPTTDAVVEIQTGGSIALTGAVRGAQATFEKTGAGALALLGDSSAFAGATKVNAGALLLQNITLGGSVNIATGAIAGGAGAIPGTVTIATGGALQTGASGALALSVGSLQLDAGSILRFDVLSGSQDAASSVNAQLSVGTLAFAGGATGSSVIISLSDLFDGAYNLATFTNYNAAAVQDFAAAHVQLNDRELTSRETVTVTAAGGVLTLTANKGNQRIFWTGADGATWSLGESWQNAAATQLPFADGDTVVFNDSAAASQRDITVNGSQVTLSGMEVTGAGSYRFSGGALVTDAASAVGLDNPTGQLLVNTTGTLTLANTGQNNFKGGVNLVNGAIVAETDNVLGDSASTLTVTGTGTLQLVTPDGAGGTGVRTLSQQTQIANGAVLTIDTSATGAMQGAITSAGNGSLVKTGTGVININAMNVATFTVAEGAANLSLGSAVAREAVNIQPNGSLSIPVNGTLQTPLLVNQGALRIGRGAGAANPVSTVTLDGNYKGDGGAIIISATSVGAVATGALMTDRLNITGTLSGSLLVKFSQPPAAFPLDTDWSMQPVVAGAIAPGATIDPNSDMLKGSTSAFARALGINPDGTITYSEIVTPEVPAMLGVDVASILIGKASLESLNNRLAIALPDDTPRKFEAWFSGLYRYDKLKSGLYDGTKANTYGAQLGVDYSAGKDAAHRFTIGVFYDYANSDMNQPRGAATTKTTANGLGAYAGLKAGAWYLDAIVRGASEDYTIDVPNSPEFTTKGNSWAASIGTGCVITGKASWNIEPQARLTYQTHKIDDTTDSVGRVYRIDSADSLDSYAGLMLSQRHQWTKTTSLTPYLRGGLTYEFKGKTEINVAGTNFASDLGALGGLGNAGVIMQIGSRVYCDADVSWYYNHHAESYGANLTVGVRW